MPAERKGREGGREGGEGGGGREGGREGKEGEGGREGGEGGSAKKPCTVICKHCTYSTHLYIHVNLFVNSLIFRTSLMSFYSAGISNPPLC